MQRTFHLLRIVICDEMVHFCSVRHSCLPVFSKLRRSGWLQKTLEPKQTAYSQPSGCSTRQYEMSRDSPRYLVRHISGSGRLRCLLTVSPFMQPMPIDSMIRQYARNRAGDIRRSPQIRLSLDFLFVSPACRPDPRPQDCHETISSYSCDMAYVDVESRATLTSEQPNAVSHPTVFGGIET